MFIRIYIDTHIDHGNKKHCLLTFHQKIERAYFQILSFAIVNVNLGLSQNCTNFPSTGTLRKTLKNIIRSTLNIIF